MKKILVYLKYNLAAGLVLLNSFVAVPMQNSMNVNVVDDIAQLMNEADSELAETSTEINSENSEATDDPDESNDSDDEDGSDDEEPEPYDFNADLIIRAVNPGYTGTDKNGQKLNEAGEVIELENLTDTELELAGYSLRYFYGSDSSITLFNFSEGSYMTGKHLLLSYEGSANAGNVDLTYSRSLALEAGPLVLYYEDEIVDSFCWRVSGDYCNGYNVARDPIKGTIKKFSQSVAVRRMTDGEFEMLGKVEYEPDYTIASGLYLPPEPEDPDASGEEKDDAETSGEPRCRGLEFSELLTYYTEDKSEQFIEFYNSASAEIDLSFCRVNYKNKLYKLDGTIQPGNYYAYYLDGQFSMTKNPKNPLTLTLVDADGEAVDEVAYGNGQKSTTSFARIFESGAEVWQVTYAITPNAENIYQKYRSCEAGKVINEATGNCVKDPSVSSTSISAKLLEPCPAGKYRNPLTGRCKNIETSSSTLKECAEGYERNPETNRCRKVTSTSGNDGADYALVPKTRADSTMFIGIGIVSLIVLIGGVYVVLQFRHEIARACRKASQCFDHIRQNLLARGIGRHRNKKP